MSLQIAILPVTPFKQNCSIWFDEATRVGVVIDPGGDVDRIMATVDELGVSIEKILVTHGHLDHASAVKALSQSLEVPVEGPHRDDKFWIDQIPEQCEKYGFTGGDRFEPDRWLEHNDTVTFGDFELGVRHCPGHTPGHVVFFCPQTRIAAVGDVIFCGSVGRTNFPRGDQATLIRSIVEHLWPLGPDMQFIPGHGPTGTFGEERQSNPFVSDAVTGVSSVQ